NDGLGLDHRLRWKEALAVIETDPIHLFNASGQLTFHVVGHYTLGGYTSPQQDLIPPQTILIFGEAPGDTGGDIPPPAANVTTPVQDSQGNTVANLTSPPNTITTANTFVPPADN